MNIQPGLRGSSGPETSPEGSTLQAGHTQLTPGINRNDGVNKAEWKTQDGVETSLIGREKDNVNAESDQGSGSDVESVMDLWSSEEANTGSPSAEKLTTDQVQQLSSGVNNMLSDTASVEMNLSDPLNSTETNFSSSEPHFNSPPPLIADPTAESELFVSSTHPPPEGGGGFKGASSTVTTSPLSEVVTPPLKNFGPNEEQEKETLKDSTPNLNISTPSTQSRGVPNVCGLDSEIKNVSSCEEEDEDKIQRIEVKTKQRAFPQQEQEGGMEKDKIQKDLEVEGEVHRHTDMEGGTHDQSSSDLMSHFNTEDFLIRSQTEADKSTNQPQKNTVTQTETELKHGIRGPRVSIYVEIINDLISFCTYIKSFRVKPLFLFM